MATKEKELQRLRQENERLKKQIERLKPKNAKPRSTRKNRFAQDHRRENKTPDNERAKNILLRAGLLTELTHEEKALAAEWRALPESRRQEVTRRLQTSRFKPTLSETIIQDRD